MSLLFLGGYTDHKLKDIYLIIFNNNYIIKHPRILRCMVCNCVSLGSNIGVDLSMWHCLEYWTVIGIVPTSH